ncbi:hypothetical protein DVH24_033806 [Malus domestica]|uniref:Leucine-rich repeat-containing N-terminal plant-type domain-containing protein n=1 Tax=Malus domestica TaxID=3750 RepID=A0A498HL75_MALDO|nr:hypothetical protein DVH24_033806 [Malus domestica]
MSFNLSAFCGIIYSQIGSNNFTGRIPDYFRSWKNLRALDLSFNRLEGSIPNFADIKELATIFHFSRGPVTFQAIFWPSPASIRLPNMYNLVLHFPMFILIYYG